MEVIISKIGAYLVSPLSVVLVIGGCGIILMLLSVRRIGALTVVMAMLLLAIAALPPVAHRLVSGLEMSYPVQPVESYPAVETIVILGGSVNMPQGRRIYTELMESSDRVLHGFRLFNASRGGRILLTGGNVDTRIWKQSEKGLPTQGPARWMARIAAGVC